MSQHHWNVSTGSNGHGLSRWRVCYDPTPGGRQREDGSRVFSLVIPALAITDIVDEPEKAAREIAIELNAHAPMLAALKRAEGFAAGFVDDDVQDGVDSLIAEVRAAIKLAEGGAA